MFTSSDCIRSYKQDFGWCSLIFPNYPILSAFLPWLTVVAETSLAGHFMEGTIITRLLLNSEGFPHLLILSRYVFDGRRLRVLGSLNSFSSHSSDPASFIFIESGKNYIKRLIKNLHHTSKVTHLASAILEFCCLCM